MHPLNSSTESSRPPGSTRYRSLRSSPCEWLPMPVRSCSDDKSSCCQRAGDLGSLVVEDLVCTREIDTVKSHEDRPSSGATHAPNIPETSRCWGHGSWGPVRPPLTWSTTQTAPCVSYRGRTPSSTISVTRLACWAPALFGPTRHKKPMSSSTSPGSSPDRTTPAATQALSRRPTASSTGA